MGSYLGIEMVNAKYLLILVFAAALSACVVIEPAVDAYVISVTPLPSSLLEQRARLSIRLQNLSEAPINATGIEIRLIVNDQQLARGVAAKDITIAGLSEATTSINVSSRAIDAIRQVIGIQQREVYNYRLKGRLYTPGRDQRFDHGGEIARNELLGLLQPAR